MKVLIDSDVIIDLLIDRKPFSEHSIDLLSLCENGKITGYWTPVMISNIYYILRKYTSEQNARTKISDLNSILEVLMIDKSVIQNALESTFKDFEDAIQNFSAEIHEEIEIIITRNESDYKHSRLSIFSPIDFLRIHS
ncbi:MAG: PIN domain-containing protein [Aquirufa sp.]